MPPRPISYRTLYGPMLRGVRDSKVAIALIRSLDDVHPGTESLHSFHRAQHGRLDAADGESVVDPVSRQRQVFVAVIRRVETVLRAAGDGEHVELGGLGVDAEVLRPEPV